MDEFVSKKLLVAKFNQLANKYIDGDKRQRGLAYTTAADMIALADAADVQPVNQWISIDERLPQDGEETLVYAGNRGVMIGLYDSVLQVWLDYECCGLKVTHWQPLPEPPKKEAENG